MYLFLNGLTEEGLSYGKNSIINSNEGPSKL